MASFFCNCKSLDSRGDSRRTRGARGARGANISGKRFGSLNTGHALGLLTAAGATGLTSPWFDLAAAAGSLDVARSLIAATGKIDLFEKCS